MESDKVVLIDSACNTDLQLDVENQYASFKAPPLNEDGPPPYKEVGLNYVSLRREHGLTVRQNQPSWRSLDFPILLSCFTLVFCGVFFGLAAFILAYLGRSHAANGNHVKFRRMSRASYAVSVSGVVIGIILIAILGKTLTKSPHHCNHETAYCNYGVKYEANGCLICCEPHEQCPHYGNLTGNPDPNNDYATAFTRYRTEYYGHRNLTGNTETSDDYTTAYIPAISYTRYRTEYCGYSYNTYDIQACAQYGSYKDYRNCTYCCRSVYETVCSYGWRIDSNGCKYGCCSSYNNDTCALYGSYNNSYGCVQCCPVVGSGRCTYGWSTDSYGCKTGCCSSYSQSDCNTYGYYFPSWNGRCKTCCPSYNIGYCSLYGSYNDSNGCKRCCSYSSSSISTCTYGWKLDSVGCKICCSYYEEHSCFHDPATPSLIAGGINDTNSSSTITPRYGSDGCGGTYDTQACQTYGSYQTSYGCTRCCSAIANGTCTYGWAKDSYGCRTGCCSYYNNASCEAYGSYVNSYNGCKYCCPSYSASDCMRYGSYWSSYYSAQCKVCCSSFRSSDCQYGWRFDGNQCRRCCYDSEEYRCSHDEVFLPQYTTDVQSSTSQGTTAGQFTHSRAAPISTKIPQDTTTLVPTTFENSGNGSEYANDGCGSRYDVVACATYGSYKDYYNCTRCCPAIENGRCTFGWAKDSNGCRKGCCDWYENSTCNANGFYISSYDGCKNCCPGHGYPDCSLYGSYIDSNNCTNCCRYFRSSDCRFGWTNDWYGCKRCCYVTEEYRCSHVILPNEPTTPRYK